MYPLDGTTTLTTDLERLAACQQSLVLPKVFRNLKSYTYPYIKYMKLFYLLVIYIEYIDFISDM